MKANCELIVQLMNVSSDMFDLSALSRFAWLFLRSFRARLVKTFNSPVAIACNFRPPTTPARNG